MAGVVRALGRSSCTLVAHDWGGAVAWVAAARYPGLVDRLVVLAGPHWRLYQKNLTFEQMARSYYFLWFQVRRGGGRCEAQAARRLQPGGGRDRARAGAAPGGIGG